MGENEQTMGADGPKQKPGVQSQIQVNAQYVKDLSFENPNAPQMLTSDKPPEIDVSVDVGARLMESSQFEVELRITVSAMVESKKAFVAEVMYGGVFTFVNIEDKAIKPVCLIECPRLLFPFARRIIADCIRDGGYPPLLLEPFDFGALYANSQSSAETAKTDAPVGVEE